MESFVAILTCSISDVYGSPAYTLTLWIVIHSKRYRCILMSISPMQRLVETGLFHFRAELRCSKIKSLQMVHSLLNSSLVFSFFFFHFSFFILLVLFIRGNIVLNLDFKKQVTFQFVIGIYFGKQFRNPLQVSLLIEANSSFQYS